MGATGSKAHAGTLIGASLAASAFSAAVVAIIWILAAASIVAASAAGTDHEGSWLVPAVDGLRFCRAAVLSGVH
jgi:hypothetical protein